MIDRWIRSRRSDTTANRCAARFGWCARRSPCWSI
ncbi:hypothetical protein O979_21175 [Mycobacterium avium subsp. paratuberculosis 10-4404]|nr:hypothetical protein O984_20965 [Mycobacterium avium 05-4293]ETA96808.1 hypothetical protein O979_21175 [Mycobacterium avium subsp. paratuberculosis 10-4404]ETA99580.1 hypothetical protein O978_21205 [Mycobacterium avium subsp. paratuberculosis 10-5864]ETB05551.1 hypothetical protein P863_20165 [Mycobacterium avium subsp. silvaticum ATCC 49884]ETB09004.1 hypothetical protein O980_20840 [Mycobacterium avium subsp. paratuberculosis 08-8281]ETB12119.1 hypothetical protein O972_22030 [Mycobacte